MIAVAGLNPATPTNTGHFKPGRNLGRYHDG
jgi:hypothetical protein